MARPFWYKLIKRLKTEGVINTGVTIPYMFGAYKTIGRPFTDIGQMILAIRDSNTDKYPVIQKCTVIGHHVIMLEEKVNCNNEYRKDIRFENSNKDGYLFISSNTNLGNTIEKFSRSLTVAYENPIRRGEYSWNNREEEWKEFETSEITLIKSIQ